MLSPTSSKDDSELLSYKYPKELAINYEGKERRRYLASIVLAVLAVEGLVVAPVMWWRAGLLWGLAAVAVATGLWLGRGRCITEAKDLVEDRMLEVAQAMDRERFGGVELPALLLSELRFPTVGTTGFADLMVGVLFNRWFNGIFVELPLFERPRLFREVHLTRSAEVTEVLCSTAGSKYVIEKGRLYRSSGSVLRILVPVDWRP